MTTETSTVLRGCRDMLRECAKQLRQRGDTGHAEMADAHANDATRSLVTIEAEASVAAMRSMDDTDLRQFRLESINQTSGIAQGDSELIDLADMDSPDSDWFDEGSELTRAQVLALDVDESLRFGGGAAPLMELTRMEDNEPLSDEQREHGPNRS